MATGTQRRHALSQPLSDGRQDQLTDYNLENATNEYAA
jgi:hypothetical protein